VFHYALKPSGFLMLGHAETIGSHSDLFAIRDKRSRLYAKKPSVIQAGLTFPIDNSAAPTMRPRRMLAPLREDGRSLVTEANRVVLDRYGPAGRGRRRSADRAVPRPDGPYLEAAPGEPNLSLLKMAREGLLYGLRTALFAARKRNEPIRREGLRVRHNGRWLDLNLSIVPLATPDHNTIWCYSILSARTGPRKRWRRREGKGRPGGRKAPDAKRGKQEQTPQAMVLRLQQELAAAANTSNRSSRSSRRQRGAPVREREILSSNEELQSTNEELDTAKEELQSTNEELNTVNEELQSRNDELSRVNSDL